LKVFNKAIANLVTKGVQFTTGDFKKFKILDTLSGFISKNEVELFTIKMKMNMMWIRDQEKQSSALKHSSQSAFCMTE
jgi:hypothetical protein